MYKNKDFTIGYFGDNEIMKGLLEQYCNEISNKNSKYVDLQKLTKDEIEQIEINCYIFDSCKRKDNEKMHYYLLDKTIMPRYVLLQDYSDSDKSTRYVGELQSNNLTAVPFTLDNEKEKDVMLHHLSQQENEYIKNKAVVNKEIAKAVEDIIESKIAEKELSITEKTTELIKTELSNLREDLKLAYQNKLAGIIEETDTATINLAISALNALEAKDPYTVGHSNRVANYACLIAKELSKGNYEKMGNTEEEIDKRVKKILLAGMLHDIGKLTIEDSVLLKPERLDNEEFGKMKRHTSNAEKLLSGLKHGEYKDIPHIAGSHHEKWDGTGYPNGLKGEDIPFEARILALADVFDAMTTKRTYNKPLDINDAIVEIERCKGTQFDPEIANAFIQVLQKQPEKIQSIITEADTKAQQTVVKRNEFQQDLNTVAIEKNINEKTNSNSGQII